MPPHRLGTEGERTRPRASRRRPSLADRRAGARARPSDPRTSLARRAKLPKRDAKRRNGARSRIGAGRRSEGVLDGLRSSSSERGVPHAARAAKRRRSLPSARGTAWRRGAPVPPMLSFFLYARSGPGEREDQRERFDGAILVVRFDPFAGGAHARTNSAPSTTAGRRARPCTESTACRDRVAPGR